MILEGWAGTITRVAAHQQKLRLFVCFLRLRKIFVWCCRFIIALFSIVFRHFRRFYAHPHVDSHALVGFVKQEKGIHIHFANFGEILR